MLAAPSLLLFLILVGTDAVRAIVGGSEAQPGAWPWQVAVFSNKSLCVGTLISSEFVLTAAHCVEPNSMRDTTLNLGIFAGEYNLANNDSEDRQVRLVARAFVHPKYHDLLADNDIALLKLDWPLQLTTKVWPACLPSQGEKLEPQTTATILGRGATSYEGNPGLLFDGKPQIQRTLMLHEARIPVANVDDCRRIHWDAIVSDYVICTGYEKGQINTCYGDSGGPLLVERNNRWYVYGVSSKGGCGRKGTYSLFSGTSSCINWINRIVSEFSTSSVAFDTCEPERRTEKHSNKQLSPAGRGMRWS